MWLDEGNTKAMLLAEQGNNIDCDEKTYKELENLGWGFFSESKYFIDKLRTTNVFNENKTWKNSPNLIFATVQITNECNSKCEFCDKFFCPVCIKNNDKQYIDKNILLDIVDSCKFYGLREILLTGGEPLLHPDFQYICSSILKKGISVSIKTSGLMKMKFPTDVKLIILLDNVNNLNRIINNYKSYKNITILKVLEENTSFKPILPEGWKLSFCMGEQCISKKHLKGLSLDEFFLKKLSDHCLTSKITIKSDGDVVPCLQRYNEIVGNIKNDEFSQIIKNLSEKYWSKPIDQRKTGKCLKCEFMYACNACVYTNCEKSCDYDVELGQWK